MSDGKLKLNDMHQVKTASVWLSTLSLKGEGYCWILFNSIVIGFSEVEALLVIVVATYPIPNAFVELKTIYNMLAKM